MAVLLVLVVFVFLVPLIVCGRFGLGWAAAEGAAFIAAALSNWLVKPRTFRTGGRWSFPYFVFLLTALLFGFCAMAFGLWLSPWWCAAISHGAATLIVAGRWHAQRSYYRHQQQLLDSERTGHE